MAEPDRSITVNDPTSMRALAHPLRLKLLGILRVEGPRSVGQLADAVDEAPGSISYHLGTLAKSGFVVEAPELARDGRERWWRAAHQLTESHPAQLREDPQTFGAYQAMRRAILATYLAEQLAALDAEAGLERPWLEASTSGDSIGHLTLEQFREFTDELNALNARWSEIGRHEGAGTTPIHFIYSAFVRP
ncbi:helix-turn-helix domain-containing protein [Rathayibacter sp. YIM 133350]|uniref:ArsR/SmtB family transcription factor n=1 Tax=Rathayibacter sp. YIM 133350 TaxID=3131992 RepID=UPI00307D8A3A